MDNTFAFNGIDNLLMEIRIFSTQPNDGFSIFAVDATNTTLDSVSRLFVLGGPGNAIASTGARNTMGLVTKFTFIDPPGDDPPGDSRSSGRTIALLAVGISAICLVVVGGWYTRRRWLSKRS